MNHPVVSGAEPWSVEGTNGCGALVLHGFTGNPNSMRGVAEALASAGFSVELPRLPGHGTHVDDLVPTRFDDWLGAADSALEILAAKVGLKNTVVVGLSMGGTLTVAEALAHPELAGIALINPAVEPMADSFAEMLEQMAEVAEVMPSIGNDIAKPGVDEGSYDATPIRALLSMADAGVRMVPRFAEICLPVLFLHSPQDHVVPPTAVDFFCERVTTEVERVVLEKSFHVATMDYDAALIEERVVAFSKRVCRLP
jgi:carboxylesterase